MIKRLLCLLLLSVLPAAAEPVLPHVLSDHMVVQRDRPIPIWGQASPGESIDVTMLGQVRSTTADAAGHWQVQLPPQHAGGPYRITVNHLELKDVMVGEVWVASGQSNMTFALADSIGGANAVSHSDLPEIRFLVVPQHVASEPQSDTAAATWQVSNPATAGKFSAVAWYYARALNQHLNVPIGVMQSAWPGTAAEEWTNPAMFATDPVLQPIAGRGHPERLNDKEHWKFHIDIADFELIDTAGKVTPLIDFRHGTTRNGLGGNTTYEWESGPDTAFELTPNGATISGRLTLETASHLWTTYGGTVDMRRYKGLRFRMRGRGEATFCSLQPTITDWDNYKLGPIVADPDWQTVTLDFKTLRQDGWGVVKPFTPQALSGFRMDFGPQDSYERPPGGLYDGMITPLTHTPARGVIWYQGESNADRARQYRALLPALVKSWRDAWQNPHLAFLVVQLPNHGLRTDTDWAEMREAQATILKLPDTGVAVTIDLGDPRDVHPHRKREVGERLARAAMARVYHADMPAGGPIYAGMVVEGSAVRVRFTGGRLKPAHLTGFVIAGDDRKFYPATARIDRDTVIVSNPRVAHPVAVRYAWADDPDVSLYNVDGFPAMPFRTDAWPGKTDDAR